MKTNNNNILADATAFICTHASRQIGFGHLSRSINLHYALESHGIKSAILLLVEDTHSQLENSYLKNSAIPFIQTSTVEEEEEYLLAHKDTLQYVFFDRGNQNPIHTAYPFLTIGIDHVGNSQHYFDILYNPLPYYKPIQTNFYGPSFLWFHPNLMPYMTKPPLPKKQTITISFGGADPYDLSYSVYEALLLEMEHIPPVRIILGPLYRGKLSEMHANGSIQILKNLQPPEWHAELYKSRVLITSFGLTPFEALALKIPVFLINHSQYHQSLGESVNLPCSSFIGKDGGDIYVLLSELQEFVFHPKIPTQLKNYAPQGSNQFFEALHSFKKPKCPECGNSEHLSIHERGFEYNDYQCAFDHGLFRHYFPTLSDNNA